MGSTAFPDIGSLLGLKGKGIVVLGAGGGGLGTESSLLLAAAGARLLCVDHDAAEAEAIAARTGGTPLAANITDRAEMERVFARADELFAADFAGIVDIVGVAKAAAIPDFDDQAIDEQFAIVFRHALLAVQIGAPMLAGRGGGSITFVSSISGLAAIETQGVYGMAKAALNQLVHTSALEFGKQNVRVNAVAPGFVQTPRLLARLPEPVWKKLAESNPLGRTALPNDIAKVILFLASDLASYVTSNIMTLDGGASHNVSLPKFS